MDIPSIEYQLVRTENRLVDTLAIRYQSSRGLEHNVDKFVTVSTCNELLEIQSLSSEEPRTVACSKSERGGCSPINCYDRK